MPFETVYSAVEPARADIDKMTGPVLLEFGTDWCGYCQGLQQDLAALMARYPQVHHIKVEDGPGRLLGRSFKVKLWPALVFLKDGQALQQVSRPDIHTVEAALKAIVS